MTTASNRSSKAREHLQADALEMLAQGRIRNAAEKAWGATKRASDALIPARTGEEPERTPETGAASGCWHPWTTMSARHGWCSATTAVRSSSTECFYNGLCEPLDETERRIRETSAYIDEAERLAEQETP